MNGYTLTDEGRARFSRIKTVVVIQGRPKIWGYEVLDYLYEHEHATVEEIENSTGLSWSQTVERLMEFVNRGYVEGYIEKIGGIHNNG